MKPNRSFRLQALDRLESRDVPSAFNVFSNRPITMPQAAPVVSPYSIPTFGSPRFGFGNFNAPVPAPVFGGMSGFRNVNPFAPALRLTTPTTSVPVSPFAVNAGTPTPSLDPFKTYLSHPNTLSTDPAVLNGYADYVVGGTWVRLSRL